MKRFPGVLNVMVAVLLFSAIAPSAALATPPAAGRELYEIKVYHCKSAQPEKVLDEYLQNVYLPLLHKQGIATIGVFKPLANDTAADRVIYVFIPLKSLEQWHQLAILQQKMTGPADPGTAYINADYTTPAYTRMESILLEAFPKAPHMQLPALTGPRDQRIYELRSYESSSEKYNENKVDMFNAGGEITLFRRLGFNGIFYAEVLSGSHMPNLMYMTSFENKQARDDHWKTFGDDAEWKALKAQGRYQNNVSKADVILCHAASYSDL